MPITVLRLGSARKANEGLRLGTVRRPPRGMPKTQFATRDYYDVWLPILSLSSAPRIRPSPDNPRRPGRLPLVAGRRGWCTC